MKLWQKIVTAVFVFFVVCLFHPVQTSAQQTMTCSDGPSYTFASPSNFVLISGSTILSSQLNEQIASNSGVLTTDGSTIDYFTGDFEVDTHISNFITNPTSIATNSAELFISNGVNTYVTVHVTTDNSGAHNAEFAYSDNTTSNTWTLISSISGISQVSDVWLRLIRSQNTISAYVEVGSNGYQLVGTSSVPLLANSNTPVYVNNQLVSDQSSTTSSVTFNNFLISCLSSSSSNSSSNTSPAGPPVCGNSQPSAPNLFQIDATNNSAKLDFTSLANNSEYYISYATTPNAEEYGTDVNLADNGWIQNFTINALNPGTAYYFKVRGQNGCMPGAWSNIMKIITPSSGTKSFYSDAPTPASLPVTGTGWPTIAGFGLGVVVIISSFILAF